MFKLPTASAMDMHLHSVYSDAPKSSIDTIEQALLEKSMGGCVCDHNEIRGSIELFSRGKVCTIPSIEVGSRERLEFLLYFDSPAALEWYYVKHIEPYKRSRFFTKLDRSFVDLVEGGKEFGAAVALPHPFAPSWKNINSNRERKARLFSPSFFPNVDLIEVINGHLPDNRNFKAFLLSEVTGKSPLAGSDAHVPETIGSVFSKFEEPLDYREMLDVLMGGIKVGKSEKFSALRTANTSRSVIGSHIRLFMSRQTQRRWMVKYDAAG